MEYVAIIISLISLVGAGFAFIRANSSHNIMVKRVEALREKINMLDERLRKYEGNAGRGNRASNEPSEGGRRKKQRSEDQEERQNKPRQERPERQNESRQERQNEPRQKQPRQEQQSREQQPEQRQEQRERQPRQQQQPNQQQPGQQLEDGAQQPRRRRENRRRNEPMDRSDLQDAESEQPIRQRNAPALEFTQGGLLDELEQSAAAPDQAAPAVMESGIRYAIIPEDGVIRAHQLQQQPDSDSYIEVDVPADGGHITKYRFNLAGNHAFVIAQGIDRLENAFDFEKPSNRMVNKVVQQQDGVLTRVGNGWRIHEKARIDFR
ncbi:hypothetical protein [Pontibacter akesuensis]|uniref:Uncharacterized protein n=1 Tax=Pontibacter akesuensis TaxID=388950 RepID=A0A1I7JZX9_9BACT|nr:hypothetical protein [Pontibacter akesuensis]GHA76198.1 hypothetical protein GCM10007389_32680 [Pontibacter akesuensis]SFU90685.1 hypothetical protein SAMN04487941_3235 [Pontibacter akesuensis]